eukprot:253055-Pelagomonas_calceolata.AAC.5
MFATVVYIASPCCSCTGPGATGTPPLLGKRYEDGGVSLCCSGTGPGLHQLMQGGDCHGSAAELHVMLAFTGSCTEEGGNEGFC